MHAKCFVYKRISALYSCFTGRFTGKWHDCFPPEYGLEALYF